MLSGGKPWATNDRIRPNQSSALTTLTARSQRARHCLELSNRAAPNPPFTSTRDRPSAVTHGRQLIGELMFIATHFLAPTVDCILANQGHPRQSHQRRLCVQERCTTSRLLYPGMLSHSALCLDAREVMNFLGRKLNRNFQGEVLSDLSSLVCRRVGGNDRPIRPPHCRGPAPTPIRRAALAAQEIWPGGATDRAG